MVDTKGNIKNKTQKLKFLLFALLYAIIFVACNTREDIVQQLDIAERMLQTHPDSALAIIENTRTPIAIGKQLSARYALLKSMALDKNCIDTTTLHIIQPAIDYYTTEGTPNEQLQTYYYTGRIYQNRHDDNGAMECFIKALDLQASATDSLLLAHALVAQATIYYKEYKITNFIENNIKASALYAALSKETLQIKSITNAIDGFVLMGNKASADSLLSICLPLAQNNDDAQSFLFTSVLSYTIEFGSVDEIKSFLDAYQDFELTEEEKLIFAEGYSKIGQIDKALTYFGQVDPCGSALDSLKYAAVKVDILEKQGNFEEAYTSYKEYSAKLEKYQNNLLSNDLLFSDQKYKLETKNQQQAQNKKTIISVSICAILILGIVVAFALHRNSISKRKRKLAEAENTNLKKERQSLRIQKEQAQIEAYNLKEEKKRLESEKEESQLLLDELKKERDNLKEMLNEQPIMSKQMRDIVKNRLEMLNGLLAREITNNENYAHNFNKLIESAHNDKDEFLNMIRQYVSAFYPKLMDYFEERGLSEEEINYLCLFAMGLRGKEIGEYMKIKRHYVISHEIRKKLGIDEHETNIGLYMRKLMNDFGSHIF